MLTRFLGWCCGDRLFVSTSTSQDARKGAAGIAAVHWGATRRTRSSVKSYRLGGVKSMQFSRKKCFICSSQHVPLRFSCTPSFSPSSLRHHPVFSSVFELRLVEPKHVHRHGRTHHHDPGDNSDGQVDQGGQGELWLRLRTLSTKHKATTARSSTRYHTHTSTPREETCTLR